MKKSVSRFVTLLILRSLLAALPKIKIVKASGTIYIRADGSVEGTDKIQRDGNVYTFTANTNDSIVVERDDIVVDGAGYTLQGTGTGYGIDLTERSNITIKNMRIKAFNYGIYLYDSSNNTISGNNITNSFYGIWLRESSNNTITENNMKTDRTCIAFQTSCNNNIISGNNIEVSHERGINLASSSNNIISGNNITSSSSSVLRQGIELFGSSNNSIYGNNITNNLLDGIRLLESYNNTISANYIANNGYGISFDHSSNNIISGNNVTNNDHGICLSSSSNNTLKDNHMNNNKYNFWVPGYDLSDFVNDVDVSNTVDGKPVYYWINRRNVAVPLDAGYVALVNCTNITVKNLNLANNGQGVLLSYTTNSTIAKNNITNSFYGIWLRESSNNNITENNIKNIGFYGIELNGHSNNNSISENNIEASHTAGIYLEGSSDNQIVGNNITNNKVGIYFGWSDDNTIYHNNFINNTKQVSDFAFAFPYAVLSVNIWDDGYPSGGNYWSDYTGVDADGDGIGDKPYIINEKNRDNYPIMPPDTTSPTISILSPENKTYTVNNVSLTFTISELTSWMGYSPDSQANVTITGNTTLTGLSDGTHSLAVYASDLFGNIGSSDTVYFTIDTTLPSITILSPENKTYDTTDIPLNFTVNEPVSWIGYSLDSQANVTITGNTILTELSEGSHNLTVYATDTYGNTGASETICFTAIPELPRNGPSGPLTGWAAWAVAVSVMTVMIVAVAGAILLVYFAKVKKKSRNPNNNKIPAGIFVCIPNRHRLRRRQFCLIFFDATSFEN